MNEERFLAFVLALLIMFGIYATLTPDYDWFNDNDPRPAVWQVGE